MSQEKQTQLSSEPSVAALQGFWQNNRKWLMIAAGAILLIGGGWFSYQEFYQAPRDQKAQDALFKAEEYYRLDSIQKALNGDGQFPGFLKVISQYDGTASANLANFYAGSCYLKLDNYEKAVKHLSDFKSDEKLTQARAYKLMGDAYADWGKLDQALDAYKQAGRHFKDDEANSPEYLFLAAYLADRSMKKTDVAIELYQEIKEKYPRSQQAFDADNYLAQLGVYTDPK
jgi:tetratricopeptide (TPR) repeat protein